MILQTNIAFTIRKQAVNIKGFLCYFCAVNGYSDWLQLEHSQCMLNESLEVIIVYSTADR